MNYAALMDASGDVAQVIVIPEGETEAYCAQLGLAGTWRHAPSLCAIGQRHHEGGFYYHWFQIPGADTGPEGAESGFPPGFEVWHNGAVWVSTVQFNVWEPGVANWHRKDGTWVQPSGATDAYALDAEVFHDGEWWVNEVAANTFAPGVSGWRLRDAPTTPEWQEGATYAVNDEVTYQGVTYRCITAHTAFVGANWQPPNVPSLWAPV